MGYQYFDIVTLILPFDEKEAILKRFAFALNSIISVRCSGELQSATSSIYTNLKAE